MNVLVLGVSGMLGNAVFRQLSSDPSLTVTGSVRNTSMAYFSDAMTNRKIVTGVDVENNDALLELFSAARPEIVVNCVGLVKQLADSQDPLRAIPLNSLLPHRLAALAQLSGARLIHISTDCVFSGRRGGYVESDFADADDLYGRTKLIGEVDYPHAITLRTSIIGRELSGARSLLCWFLSQTSAVRGYRKAIFSGLPTNELARVIRDYVLPRPDLSGLYHVAAAPIDKYSLLQLVAKTYGKTIEIIPDDRLVIDRSLCAERFRLATGYVAPPWPELVNAMFEFN